MKELINYLEKIPAINLPVASGIDEGLWWVKFEIDIKHKFAWHTIQELGYVVNYLSTDEPLPTLFFPVSPPPYLNGGPNDFLAWVIETNDNNFKPKELKQWLENRLPNPVDDLNEWDVY